jgi:uncharacterized protein
MADPHPSSRPDRPGGSPVPQPEGSGDPSMEDILASIRRILNEDEAAASPANPPMQLPPATLPPPAAEEPLHLTREMLVGDPPEASPPRPPPPAAPLLVQPAQAAAAPAPVDPPAAPAASLPTAASEPRTDALLAPATAAAASASLGSLLRAVAAERGSGVARSGGPTVEDVVREELRPLLKEWLDQHLPAVVERLVRAEIERVVGRALS